MCLLGMAIGDPCGRLRARLLARARRLTGDAFAEDAVQIALMKIIERFAAPIDYDGAPVWSYAWRTVHGRILNEARARRRRDTLDEETVAGGRHLPDADPAYQRVIARIEPRIEASASLTEKNGLRAAYYRCMLLMDLTEVAQRLGVSRAAACVYAARGRPTLTAMVIEILAEVAR